MIILVKCVAIADYELNISIKLGNSRIFMLWNIQSNCPQIHWVFNYVFIMGYPQRNRINWLSERPRTLSLIKSIQYSRAFSDHLIIVDFLDSFLFGLLYFFYRLRRSFWSLLYAFVCLFLKSKSSFENAYGFGFADI